MSQNFTNCHTKIRHVDAHATLNDGVVVQVMGLLSNNNQALRRFMQTFVLAPEVGPVPTEGLHGLWKVLAVSGLHRSGRTASVYHSLCPLPGEVLFGFACHCQFLLTGISVILVFFQ